MANMRYLFLLLLIISCTNKSKSQETTTKIEKTENLIAVLDTIFQTEQIPLQLRDSLIEIYGPESEEMRVQERIGKKNHIINERKVKAILAKYGWPTREMMGENGNLTICNVIQHSDNDTRVKYLPMMKQAVIDGKLEARFLVRAEDRIATETGKLQKYGGQMKYYPETKSFNVWPVYDPVNIDKRRAEIGLDPIADFLKNRFDFKWDLEEQIKRSEAFEKARLPNK